MRTFFGCVILAVLGSLVAAQETRPTTRPASPSAGEMLDRMLRPGSTVARPGPTTAAVDKTSGAGAVAPNAPALTVLPEGTYLVDRIGRLVHGADGQQWEFAFDADGKALRDPPLVVLPNKTLMGIESAVSSLSREPRLRITGMVTEYRGRNYILLDKAVFVSEAADPLK